MKEAPQLSLSGLQGMLLSALLQASLRGCANVVALANGEVSSRELGLSLMRDVRSGALVWATCNGTLKMLSMGELLADSGGALGILGSVCGTLVQHPTPVIFGVLGAGWLTMRYVEFAMMKSISREQLHAEMVLTCASNGSGIAVNLFTTTVGLPMLSRLFLTCAASHCAGVWAYEAWRAARQRDAEAKLRSIALEVVGLAPGFTAEKLRRRWRLLARYSHPDRNTRPEARLTFAVFSLCRDVLAQSHERPTYAGHFRAVYRTLLNRLRRTPWIARADLPHFDAPARSRDEGA
eukprot:gnl/TRDRNA2_/TRDRNA2_120402_c3_seq1.p1 gnl/TRDRNA2_/TRDRNA2_120402_c3~~gnl/TRDRNA2_/TRDRNA2_120402_c3_seq1.p1  ORF type:complete len:293 (-),score=39.21 gnl/TRDRNA2_/TRDRNA2_120402_c3_seq1:4-882(-)